MIQLLNLFGDATGLRTNFAKSSVSPICCTGIDLQELLQDLGCPIKNFPCTYLGMPLADTKLMKNDLQPICDKLVNRMKGWKMALLTLDGRLDLVRTVLSAMPIFQMIALILPAWLAKLIDKVRRGFLWEGSEVASGGKCLVSWRTVCRPKELGGLGITNLLAQSRALRMRWLWQSWTDNNKAWTGLELPIDHTVRALFNASVEFLLGNGERILFWKEPWYKGVSLQHAFPALFEQCTRKNLTVAQAIGDGRWVRHLQGRP